MRAAPLLVLVAVLTPAAGSAPSQPIGALAPFEIWADGLGGVRGVAIDRQGRTHVAERETGRVTRINLDRSKTIVASGLARPIGLAFDAEERLLIAEERAGRVVRVEPNGRRTAIITGVKQPRWLAVDGDGTVYVAARRLTRDADPEPDDESAESETILALHAPGPLVVFADGFRDLQGLATGEGALYAATRGRQDTRPVEGAIYRIPILPGASAGTPALVGAAGAVKKPLGLARDSLGALFVTSSEPSPGDDRARRAVVKVHPAGVFSRFADGLEAPQGLAFDPLGNLHVADGHRGRLLRFRAPPAPVLAAPPAFTSHSPIALVGHAEADARIDVFGAAAPVSVLADGAGTFSATIEPARNAASTVSAIATGHRGGGLSSLPAEAMIVHDDVPPSLVLDAPPAGTFVGPQVAVRARAGDGGSQVATLALAVEGRALPGLVAPPLPAAAAEIVATWNTLDGGEGSRTLTVLAADRAGNGALLGRTVVVDHTPPDTAVTSGPPEVTAETSVTIGYAGTDNMTPLSRIEFAWRLDGGAWSAFTPDTTALLSNLPEGSHHFEVKARDLAGNEDDTPAGHRFTVSRLRVAITDPADGAVVPTGLLPVRGTVEPAAPETGVTVNDVPAAVAGTSFLALVPIDPALTSLEAVAVGPAGGTARHAIAIGVLPAPPRLVHLHADPWSGLAPLTVTFTVAPDPAVLHVSLDADGDETPEAQGAALGEFPFTFTQPGRYIAAATITHADGSTSLARAAVTVHDRPALDALLRAQWSAMKDALRRGDIAAGVSRIVERSRADYASAFGVLTAHLPNIDAILTDIQLVAVRNAAAIYEMARTDDGIAKSFEIRFAIDGDGVWRLEAF